MFLKKKKKKMKKKKKFWEIYRKKEGSVIWMQDKMRHVQLGDYPIYG